MRLPHVVLHYGQYKLGQLFEVARRSRACAYLADGDHGRLAHQEILSPGCPVVGVRTGAPFIRDGVTSVVVERLPPRAKCVKTDADQVALATFLTALRWAMDMHRQLVRDTEADEFDTARLADRIAASLELVRVVHSR